MRLKKRTSDLGKHGGCTCIFIPRPVFCGHLPARLRKYSMQQHVLKAEDGEFVTRTWGVNLQSLPNLDKVYRVLVRARRSGAFVGLSGKDNSHVRCSRRSQAEVRP